MRLINVQSLLDFEEKDIIPQTKVVQNFSDESIGDTQYATLSHCWCKTLGEELQFKEMDQLAGHDASKLRRRFGYKKIVESCLKARDDELEWLWVDPCCVAKVNIIELSEAINSMYRWFENSARCYAYLHDVDGSSLPIEADTRRFPDTNGWPAWFSCSWALPQLIAPKNVEFFNRNWDRIGEKEDLASTLARITQIPEDILAYGLPHPDDPCRPSVAQIMSWAADREGNQVEDRTYAITGLFGVHTPVKYGEKKGAFHHLQVSILKEYNDHSIFAWSSNRTLGFGSVLADDPNDFRDCGDLLRLDPLVAFVKECPDAETEIEDHETFQVTPGKGIEIWLPAVGWSSFSSHVQVKLACCREFGNGELITLNLAAVSSTDNTSFVREFEDIAPLPDQPRFQKLSLDLRDVRHIESYGSLKTSSSKADTRISQRDMKKRQDIAPSVFLDLDNNVPSPLEEAFDTAARHSTNLNGQVRLEKGKRCLQGSRVFVCQGILGRNEGQKRVAVKISRMTFPEDLILKYILREVLIWSKLHHENIIGLLGITIDFGSAISTISEWMGMGDAHMYVQDEKNDPRPLFTDIAAGLQYLHTHECGPIIHGGISGCNILVSDDRRALLSSFRYSSLPNSMLNVKNCPPQSDTLNWMAPEVLRDFEYSTAGDVWAFGMTMLELFTRSVPFAGIDGLVEVRESIIRGDLPTCPTEGSTCFRMTDPWWVICMLCWKQYPSSRPKISEIHRRIKDIVRPAPPKKEMDTSVVLQDFFRRATKFSPNLNGQVCIDYTESPKYGGVAFVRRGVLHWEKEKTMVAVKTFRQVVDDINKLEHILWEVHIHSKLNHKNILRMLGISTDFDNTISIISPWMGMGDAHTYVQLEQNDPRPLLRDTASGLHYLHTHDLGPIVHGDLKGMNVLVSDDHRALLAGFSFSTLTKPSLGMNGNPRQGGTLRWMAPELVDDFNPSVAGDIWAYGMTVLELFTRLRPFHAKSSSASVVVSIIEARLPDRPTKASTCSRMTDAWWDICTLCWQKDPSSRPTASELLEKIREIMGSA